jgi:hypothetical protein
LSWATAGSETRAATARAAKLRRFNMVFFLFCVGRLNKKLNDG